MLREEEKCVLQLEVMLRSSRGGESQAWDRSLLPRQNFPSGSDEDSRSNGVITHIFLSRSSPSFQRTQTDPTMTTHEIVTDEPISKVGALIELPFPPVTKEHILNCSYHSWHPK